MAEISFNIQYFIKVDGKEWADLSEEFTESLLKQCSAKIMLNFNEIKIEPSHVELSEVDTWSEIPKLYKDCGFDAFASIYIVFDINDELIEDFTLDYESEEYVEDIDEILGKGVYDADPQLPITRPTALQILL